MRATEVIRGLSDIVDIYKNILACILKNKKSNELKTIKLLGGRQ
jgi:hypothetical protein